jgi:hypothetical protein
MLEERSLPSAAGTEKRGWGPGQPKPPKEEDSEDD